MFGFVLVPLTPWAVHERQSITSSKRLTSSRSRWMRKLKRLEDRNASFLQSKVFSSRNARFVRSISFEVYCHSASPTGKRIVAVVGATGRVGSLVTKELSKRPDLFSARAVVRSKSKAAGELPSGIDVVEANISDVKSLASALEGVDSIICCTGSTAFPTKKWSGGNSPEQVDVIGVQNLVQAVPPSLKHLVFLSSVGVTRCDQFPFFVLNFFKALESKFKGEQIIEKAAAEKGFAYTHVRPLRLAGVGSTTKDESIQLLRGDTVGAGGVSRLAVAQSMVESLLHSESENIAFEVLAAPKNARCGVRKAGSTWDDAFAFVGAVGEEVFSVEFNKIDCDRFYDWAYQWANSLPQSASTFPPLDAGLKVDRSPHGIVLSFVSADFDTGEVVTLGELTMSLEKSSEGRTALKVRRSGEPTGAWKGGWGGKPAPSEAQVLGLLAEQLQKRTTS